MQTKPSARNNYLDWLRVLAILYVFIYHSARFFNLEDWHVKNATRYLGVEVWTIASWNWMMPLIFVISGASLFYAVGKGSHGKFIKDKVLRLFVPWLVGITTHATLQVYLDRTTHGLFHGSYFQFLPAYFERIFTEYGILGLFEMDEMHLWYLWWLFLFTLLLYPLMLWLKRGGRRVLDGLGAFLSKPGTVYLLALPSVLMMALLDPNGAIMAEKGGGWSMAIYFWLLLSGFILTSSERLQASIRRLRWLSLGLGAVLLLFVLVVVATTGVPVYGTALYTLGMGIAAFSSWCWVLAWFGLAMRYLDFRKPALEYANQAVLPFYILHQTVLICVGYFIVQLPISDLLKWVGIAVISFGIIMGIYEYLIRRINVLRFLFGMKVQPKQNVVPAIEARGAQA